MEETSKSILKIMVIGDVAVGKTALVKQYVNKNFELNYKATIGADFLVKDILVEDQLVCLQIWDTAGFERFASIGTAYFRGADAAIIVFDLTNRKSYEHLDRWKDILLNETGTKDGELPLVIIGNKVDLTDQRTVSEKEVLDWCKTRTSSEKDHQENDKKKEAEEENKKKKKEEGEGASIHIDLEPYPYFEASAKEYFNLDQAFIAVARKAIKNKKEQQHPLLVLDGGITLEKEEKIKISSGGGCACVLM